MENNDENLYFHKLDTIIENIFIIKSEKRLRSIEIIEEKWKDFNNKHKLIENKDKYINEIIQLEEYFAGNRKVFDLIFDIKGTDFRNKVWMELFYSSFIFSFVEVCF